MRRRWRALTIAILATVGLLLTTTGVADATVAANGPWLAGKVMTDSVSTSVPRCTLGPELYSSVNGHYYKTLPRHCVEPNGYGTGVPNPPNNVSGVYNGDTNNWFNSAQVLWPSHPYYSHIDLVAIDIGTGGWPHSDDLFNYCWGSSYTNCSSYLGGGTSVNPWNTGLTFDIKGYLLTHVNWVVCKSGAISGTSCGTVVDENLTTIAGSYTSPTQRASGLTDCNVTFGDSGAPVFGPKFGESDGGVWVEGMVVGMSTDQIAAGPNHPCYSNGRTFGVTFSYIDIIDMVDSFPGYGMWVVT